LAPRTGVDPVTFWLRTRCSSVELTGHEADDSLDLHLPGSPGLYAMSYVHQSGHGVLTPDLQLERLVTSPLVDGRLYYYLARSATVLPRSGCPPTRLPTGAVTLTVHTPDLRASRTRMANARTSSTQGWLTSVSQWHSQIQCPPPHTPAALADAVCGSTCGHLSCSPSRQGSITVTYAMAEDRALEAQTFQSHPASNGRRHLDG
jgi:hypothetical protein